MNELTLNFDQQQITIKTHEIDGQTLYKAQDLLKGYGMSVKKCNDTLRNWKRSKTVKLTVLKGKHGGTYLTRLQTIKLAGFISEAFEDAVYEAFDKLLSNDTQEAAQIAHSVVFDLEYAKSVEQRWKAFIKWCYSYKGFGSVHKFYGGNVVRMVMDYALGHYRNASIKGLSGNNVMDKLIDMKEGAAIQAIDAQLGLIKRDLSRPSVKKLLADNKGKRELYAEWKVTYNWRDDEEYHALKAA